MRIAADSMKHQTKSSIEIASAPPTRQASAENPIDSATLELLESWRFQDATSDPEELRAAEQELTEFRAAMNSARAEAGEPALYP